MGFGSFTVLFVLRLDLFAGVSGDFSFSRSWVVWFGIGAVWFVGLLSWGGEGATVGSFGLRCLVVEFGGLPLWSPGVGLMFVS